jgi:hypothetical protein|nr:MAG TPA: stabilization protein [Caudoviricetes sp.]
MSESGDLITRIYNNFRGVDFTDKNVVLQRSPDALNMWKNYRKLGKSIQTRPAMELFKQMDNSVYGLFFYTINTVEHMIIHCGASLYDYNMSTEEIKTIKSKGMNPRRSESFIFNNIFYIKDGINYLEYDGETCKELEGYIPTTTNSRAPLGGGTMLEDYNMLTGYRKNSFCADGENKEYHLDSREIEAGKTKAWINGVETTDFTVDTTNGIVTFNVIPEKPLTDGQDNVVIQFCKTISGDREKILKCNLLCVFDNRVFFGGNQDYPNTIFHTSLNNPRYVSSTDYYNEGLDMSPVRSMVVGNNALWVFKEPSQANTSIYYHNPATYEDGKAYPSIHSSISTGCVAKAINFNDDIVFFSDRGMEGINGDVTTEQVVAHRSTLIDSKLLEEPNYKALILQEWEGYLLVIIDNKIYLADSRAMYTNSTHNEYEWFYWELEKNITFATVKDNILYLCSNDGIYTLTKENGEIDSYWTTCLDDFGSPSMQKTTNKRGCLLEVESNILNVYTKIDNGEFELINRFNETKGYVVPRIKKKKWKDIQLKIASDTPFKLSMCTLQSFIGGYVKR